MKTYLRVILLVTTLASFASLAYLTSAQRAIQQPAADLQAADLPLYLNGDAVGSVGNTKPMVTRLGALDAKVDKNANLPDGGLPSLGRIVVMPSEKLSIGGLGKIWDGVTDYFGFPPFENVVIWNGESCSQKNGLRPRPVFVLSNVTLSGDELRKIKASEQCALPAEIYTPTVSWRYYSRFVKSHRLFYTSIEITDSGDYLLNEQAASPRSRVSPSANLGSPSFGRRVDAAVVKQRPIAAQSLEKEIGSWIARRSQEGSSDLLMDESDAIVLPIIASSKASYSALARVLHALDRSNLRLIVVIN